ncbi:hypothetical protein, partial [Craterilacuibacter sp.]|uniref:hypothetical protein n=1 Tax=Craterilacuibacter sp. TaxID=2870909 RepID=UPI003F31CA84
EGFYVDTDADQPPGYHDTPPEAGWMLDTRPLVDALRQQLQMQGHGTPGAHAEDGELFQALLHDCQRKAERHEVRIKMGGTLSLVSTLPACWHHSNGGSWAFASTGDSSEELIYHSQLARRSPPPAPASMTIINRSCSGMQLAGNSHGHPLRAGELLLLREQGQSAWQCALLHWVGYGDALDTRCGLELLPGPVEAVMTRFDHAKPGDTSTLALKLSPADAAPLLLLAGRPYQRLAGMTLISDAASERVRLLRVVKQMPHFQLIEVRPV